MKNTKKLFEPLDEIDAPDRWAQISERIEGAVGVPTVCPFAVALGATILVTVGIVVGLIAAFQPRTPEGPVGQSPSPAPVADVHLGEMTQLDIGPNEGSSMSSMADGFGSAWVIGQFEQPGVNQLRRFDPKSGSVEARSHFPSVVEANGAAMVSLSGTGTCGRRPGTAPRSSASIPPTTRWRSSCSMAGLCQTWPSIRFRGSCGRPSQATATTADPREARPE